MTDQWDSELLLICFPCYLFPLHVLISIFTWKHLWNVVPHLFSRKKYKSSESFSTVMSCYCWMAIFSNNFLIGSIVSCCAYFLHDGIWTNSQIRLNGTPFTAPLYISMRCSINLMPFNFKIKKKLFSCFNIYMQLELPNCFCLNFFSKGFRDMNSAKLERTTTKCPDDENKVIWTRSGWVAFALWQAVFRIS